MLDDKELDTILRVKEPQRWIIDTIRNVSGGTGGNDIKIKRLSAVLTIIENDWGETYAINTESGFPIKDNDIKEIVNGGWSFWDVKATYQLLPYDKEGI